MNKQIAIVLLAFAAAQLVACQDQAEDAAVIDAIETIQTEDHEADQLVGKAQVFTEGCKKMRDSIYNDARTDARKGSSALFKAMLDRAIDIADEVMDVEKTAVVELAKIIQDPNNADIDHIDQEDVRARLEAAKDEMANKGAIGRGICAFKNSGAILYKTLTNSVSTMISKIAAASKVSGFAKVFIRACKFAENYHQEYLAQLEQLKSELLASESDDETKKIIQDTNTTNLKCATNVNLRRVSAFCQLVEQGKEPIFKFLGIKADKNEVAQAIAEVEASE